MDFTKVESLESESRSTLADYVFVVGNDLNKEDSILKNAKLYLDTYAGLLEFKPAIESMHENIVTITFVKENLPEIIQAKDAKEMAEKWATLGEDEEVADGQFSAKHYALKSSASANASSASAGLANEKATLAVDSANSAESNKNKSDQFANEDENVEVETGKFSSKHHAIKSAQSATASNESANTAQSHKEKAEQWADADEDVEVETGKFGARHHAIKASKSATSANESATQAGQSVSQASEIKNQTQTLKEQTEEAKTQVEQIAQSMSEGLISSEASDTKTYSSNTIEEKFDDKSNKDHAHEGIALKSSNVDQGKVLSADGNGNSEWLELKTGTLTPSNLFLSSSL